MRSWTGSLLSAAVVLAVVVVAVPTAMSADGIAIAVKQAADVNRPAGQRPLQEQDPVFMGDVIKTNRVGTAQIRLSDNTRLAVGPNSLITIDRFVLSGNTATEVTLNAVRGAFRFVTGDSNHEAYTINTPTATIGVRGTILDVSILAAATRVAVFGSGEAGTCKKLRRTECVPTVTQCGVAVIPAAEPVREINDDSERVKTLLEDFPLLVDDRQLAPEFRVDPIRSCGVSASQLQRARIEAKLQRDPPPIDRSSETDPVTTASVPEEVPEEEQPPCNFGC